MREISNCLKGTNGELCVGSYGVSGKESSLRKSAIFMQLTHLPESTMSFFFLNLNVVLNLYFLAGSLAKENQIMVSPNEIVFCCLVFFGCAWQL